MILTFEYQDNSGGAFAIRVLGLTGAQAGQVLDFNDNTFKAIGSATAPYLAATERTGINGAGKSSYTVDLDLSHVNTSAVYRQYLVKWYTGNTPATTINPVKSETIFAVENANASLFGRNFLVNGEISVKSTAGDAAQMSLWLEDNGVLVPLATLSPLEGAAVTGQIVARQFGSGVNAFTQNFVAGDLINNVFEKEYNPSPGNAIFSNDRQYDFSGTITVNGRAFTGEIRRVVIG